MKFMSTLLVVSMLLSMAAPAMARPNHHRKFYRNNNYARTMVRRNPGMQAYKQAQAQQYIQQQQYMAQLEARRQGLDANGKPMYGGYFNNPWGQQYNPYAGYYGNGYYGNGYYGNNTAGRILNSIFR